MPANRRGPTQYRAIAIACLITGLLNACAIVGPRAISNGRMRYNEAITRTNNQQMLLAIINDRYQETSSLLAVASVTANIRISSQAGVQIGVGDSDNYAGNLVPFSAETLYEENPTISYVPVAGSRYLRQLSAPTPLASLAQISGTLVNAAPVFRVLIASVNGIKNPDFLYPAVEPDGRFARLVELMVTLRQGQYLHWVGEAGNTEQLALAIHHVPAVNAAEVRELLGLLGLPPPGDHAQVISVPVSLGLDARGSGGIGIATRSVLRLVEILSAAVEVPERDRESGAAAVYPPRGPMASALRIRWSPSAPAGAAISVPYRDGWFYIADNDLATKGFFKLAASLWAVALADAAGRATAAPVLTVPVSR